MKKRTTLYPLLVSTVLAASAPGCGNPPSSTSSSTSGPEGENVGQVNSAADAKCSNGSELPPTVVGTETLARQAFTVTMPLGKGKQALSVALTSTQSMSLGNGSSVKGYGVAFGPVLNAGDGRLDLKAGSTVGDVLSHGEAELRSGSHVVGTLVAAQLKKHNKATIDGQVQLSPDVTADETLAWSDAFPAAAADNIDINRCALGILPPKRYGRVRVDAGGRLRLEPGIYYFDELHLNHRSTLELAADPGAPASPVVIYVRNRFSHRGEIPFVNGKRTDLTIVYLGNEDLLVDSAANGAIIAPSASVKFQHTPSPHHTHVFARQIDVLNGAQIVHEPARGLLTVSSNGEIEQCAERVPTENGLTGQAQEEQYQADIIRYCTGIGMSPCLVALSARANTDYFAAARRMIERTFTPAQYLAVSRDRTRKMKKAESDPAYAALLCREADADEDWVVDSHDKCPGTPELTATDDDGCPLASLPNAPPADLVAAVIEKMGVLINPKCSGAKVPSRVAAGAFYWPSDASRGSYIIVGRVDTQPAGCPVWYQIQIQELTGATAGEMYDVAFMDREEHTNLVELGKPVPASFIQFNPRPGDVGTRTRLATTGGRAKIRFRVRGMNGNGVRGPWSLWKISTRQSCWALGFDCQDG